MKKRLLSIVLLLCMVLSLSACAKNYSLEKTLDGYTSEYHSINQSTHISKLNDADYEKTLGCFAIFTKDSERIIYDMEKRSVLKTLNNTFRVNGFVIEDATFLLVSDEDSTTLYDRNYNSIANAKKVITSVTTSNLDLFVFNGTVYRVSGNTATEVGKSAFLPNIADFDETTAGYYYKTSSSEVYVYDSNLKPVSSWINESDEDLGTSGTFVLANGNVLIQTQRVLSNEAKKYDYEVPGYLGTMKIDVASYIMNPKNGKLREVNLDYVVTSVMINDGTEGINAKIKNIAEIHLIEDKRILNAAEAVKTVSLKDNGKIDGYLYEGLVNFDPNGESGWLAKDRFAYESMSGESYITDQSGKTIATVSSISNYNEIGVVIGGVIYDWSLGNAYDLEENDMTLVSTKANCFILKDDEGTYYRYAMNNPQKIDGTVYTGYYTASCYYVVNTEDGDYEVYNDAGTKIGTFESNPYVVASYEGNYIVSVSVWNSDDYSYTYEYYIFSK